MFFINLIVCFGCLVTLQNIQLLGQNVALAQASQEIKYQFYQDELKTWYEARNFCSSKNMKLAEILSYDQQQHLRQYIRNNNLLPKDSTSGYWLGGRLTGRTWFWDATGLNPSTDTRYMFGWQFGRPQTEWKNGKSKDCMELQYISGPNLTESLSWNDMWCDEKRGFICEYRTDKPPDQ